MKLKKNCEKKLVEKKKGNKRESKTKLEFTKLR
jgi:hypothetical protein